MARSSAEPFLDSGIAFVAAGWFGMLVGVSFLATPVKFQVSSLDLGVALEVGRVTFAAFTKAERVLCLLVSVAALWRRPSSAEMLLPAAAVLIVLAQAFWLLPTLDARVEAVKFEVQPNSLSRASIVLIVGSLRSRTFCKIDTARASRTKTSYSPAAPSA